MNRCGVIMVSLVGAASAVADAEVKIVGQVIHTGFPSGGNELYRPGRWCSAVVTLRNEGTSLFSGRLAMRQADKDGDMMIMEAVVSLAPDSQDRTYRLDFVANQPGPSGSFVVQVEDEQGRRVPVYEGGVRHEVLRAPAAQAVPEEAVLVLDLSSRPVALLDRLADNSKDSLKRPVTITRLGPAYLPDRAYALQSIQGIVWDAPDLTRLQPQQVQALMDYVRAGGVLVIGAGRTADALVKSPLGRILPVTAKGTRSAEVLQNTYKVLLRVMGKGQPESVMYNPPITLAGARAKRFAVALASQDDLGIDVVTRGHWGSGVVIFVAAELRDLFQQTDDASRFFQETLGLLENPNPKGQARAGLSPQHDLYRQLQSAIAFESVGGAFLMVVILFVAGYILLASLATWAWLRRKIALQHSWTVFAVVAMGSSVLSVGIVQAVRGVTTDLRQMSIVDVWVPPDGSPARQCQTFDYFGLKTGIHTRLDLRLGSARGDETPASPTAYLYPLPPELQRIERSYVAPETYVLRPGQAAVEGLPIRATLKRLQGYEATELGGTFSASIAADSDRIAPGSWIRNDLGFDLHDCWLIRPRRPQGTVISRMGQEDRRYQIFVHQVAVTLKTGGLHPIDAVEPVDPRRWPTLVEAHKRWTDRFIIFGPAASGERDEMPKFAIDSFQAALMLVTTLDDYNLEAGSRQSDVQFDRTFAQHLDRCHLLTDETAMLIGFADVPGPTRLYTRPAGAEGATWRQVEPEISRTMFRFIIPVRRVGDEREASS
jgi:hypothetical protein